MEDALRRLAAEHRLIGIQSERIRVLGILRDRIPAVATIAEADLLNELYEAICVEPAAVRDSREGSA